MTLKDAIIKTLAYSDVFDYPLTIEELCHYLVKSASQAEVQQCLYTMREAASCDGYYYLSGREAIVKLRKKRLLVSEKKYQRAIFWGRIMGQLPFVRMVALTGSLAVRNCDDNCDYDYMLVSKPGRLWVVRAFALLLNRIANLFGDTLCPNLIVSENKLEWGAKDLYSAREIEQMVCVSGYKMYSNLRIANKWIKDYLPNVEIETKESIVKNPIFQKFSEAIMPTRFINKLEAWEMNRKVSRFSKQAGFGVETNFNADICQGNFDHHGKWTLQQYEKRLELLKVLA